MKEECEHKLAALVDEDSVLDVLLFAESRNITRLLDAGKGSNSEALEACGNAKPNPHSPVDWQSCPLFSAAPRGAILGRVTRFGRLAGRYYG